MDILKIMISMENPAHICILFLGIVDIIMAINKFYKKRKTEGIVLVLIALITFACDAVIYVNDSVSIVPDLVACTYQEAEYKAGDLGLSIEVIDGHGQYVKSQNLTPGEPCQKGDVIQLELEEYRSSKEAIATFEEEVGGEYTDIVCQLRETEIKLLDDNLTVLEQFGYNLSSVHIIEAYLACEKHGIRYVDYEYENGVIIFKHVPINAEYVFVIKAEGYEEEKYYMEPSKRKLLPDLSDYTYYITLDPEGRSFEMGSTIFFVNENKEFLPGFEFSIEWLTGQVMNDGLPDYRAYNADASGRVPFLCYVYDDYRIRVSYTSHEGYHFELENEIVLGKASNEDTLDYYIMVNSDGTMNVLNSVEFWN